MNKKHSSRSHRAPASQQTRTSQRPSSPNRVVEFNPDYSYVIKDLRRIGLLAGSFMVILVVLSFFLR